MDLPSIPGNAVQASDRWLAARASARTAPRMKRRALPNDVSPEWDGYICKNEDRSWAQSGHMRFNPHSAVRSSRPAIATHRATGASHRLEESGAEIQSCGQRQQPHEHNSSAEQRDLPEEICPQRCCGKRPHESVCDGGDDESPHGNSGRRYWPDNIERRASRTCSRCCCRCLCACSISQKARTKHAPRQAEITTSMNALSLAV